MEFIRTTYNISASSGKPVGCLVLIQRERWVKLANAKHNERKELGGNGLLVAVNMKYSPKSNYHIN